MSSRLRVAGVICVLAAATIGGVLHPGTRAIAEEPLSLASAVPSDAILYARWDGGGERGFAGRYLEPFFQECARSGFVDAWVREARAAVDAEDRAAFDRKAAHWLDLLADFDLRTLLSREVALAVRVGPAGRPEMLLLVRVGDARDRLLSSLREILYGVAGEGGDIELEVGDRGGAATTLLYSRIDPGEQIAVSGRDDIIAIASSMQLLRQSFRLLDARGRDTGFVSSEVYLSARDSLKSSPLAALATLDDAGAPIGELELFIAPGPLFREAPDLDVLESYHLVSRLHERAILSQSRSRLRDGVHAFTAALVDQRSVRDLVRQVPDGARGFRASAGFSPAALWRSGLQSAATLFGERFLREELEESLGAAGFDPEILAAFTGRRLGIDTAEGRTWFLELHADGSVGTEADATAESGEANRSAREKLISLLESAQEHLAGWPVEWQALASDPPTWQWKVPLLEATGTISVGKRALRVADHAGADPLKDLDRKSETSARSRSEESRSKEPSSAEPGWLPSGDLDQVSASAGARRFESLRWLLRAGGVVGTLFPDGKSSVWKPLLVALPTLDRSLGSLEFFRESKGAVVRKGREYEGVTRTTLEPRARF